MPPNRSGGPPGEPPMIEFLAPDARAFGDAGADTGMIDHEVAAEFDEPDTRPRWLGGVAALVVGGLIVAGVVAAAPWSDSSATPPTTSIPPTTTTTTTTTVVPDTGEAVLFARPGLVLDPPPGFDLVGASTVDGSEPAGASGWGEVWAVPGATRTNGAWFSLTLGPESMMFGGPRGERTSVDVGGRRGTFQTFADGVRRLGFDVGQTDTSRSITLTAFGLSQEELVALAGSIGIDDDRPQLIDDRPVFLDPALIEGFERIAARRTTADLVDAALLGLQPVSSAYYDHAGTGEALLVEEVTAAIDPYLLRLAATPVGYLPGSWTVPEGFDGDDLVMGSRLIGDVTVMIAWFALGDAAVVLATSGSFQTLLELLPAVRRASNDEWAAALDADEGGSADPAPSPAAVGYVIDDDRREWTITSAASPMSVTAVFGRFQLWATPGRRASGAWVAVHTPVVPSLTTRPAARIAIGTGTGAGTDVAVLATDDSGVTTLDVGAFDEGFRLTSFGWSADELVALATAYQRSMGATLDVVRVRADHQPVIDRPTDAVDVSSELVRDETASTSLTRSDGALVTIVTQPESTDAAALIPFVMSDLVSVAGTDALVGGFVGSTTGRTPWTSIATFVEDGPGVAAPRRVIAWSTLPVDELADVVPRIQRSSRASWTRLLRLPEPAPGNPSGKSPGNAPGNGSRSFVDLAGGGTTTGIDWTMQVDVVGEATALVGFELRDGSTGSRRAIPLDVDGLVTIAQTGPGTAVVWRIPVADVPTGAVGVRITGTGWSATAALVRLRPDAERVYAAHVYSELGSFSWSWVDADGAKVVAP